MPVGSSSSIVLGAALILITYWKFFMKKKRINLRDKVVLITGASSGLGEACAHAFYQAGAKLILCARREDQLYRVKQALMVTKCSVQTHEPKILVFDVTDSSVLKSKVAQAIEQLGGIDILVNNAGISFRGEVKDTDLNVDRQVMEVNYYSQVALTKAILPTMLERKSGTIVSVSSIQGKLSIPFRSAYSASKHATQAFFDCLRSEVSDHNINVTVVSPGYIQTNLSTNAVTADGSQYGVTDDTTASGMKPEYVAKKILQAVQYGDTEVILAPFIHRVAVYIRTIAPGIFFKLMNSRARKQRKLENNLK